MKRDYYHEQFQQNSKNIRKTWQIMRNIIKKVNDKSNIRNRKIENIETTNPKKISEGFCNYFTNVGPDLSKQIPPPIRTYQQYISIKTPTNSLFLYPTDPNEINSIVKRMQPKKSTGQDNISSWLLKQINETICQPVAILINKSMEEGTFPNKLKISKIIPIYKSEDKGQLNNYRPISLLPSISKIYEKVVYKRLYNFINPSLYERQFGFCAKRSTIQAIIELNTDIIESFEDKDITMATFTRLIQSI